MIISDDFLLVGIKLVLMEYIGKEYIYVIGSKFRFMILLFGSILFAIIRI